MEKYEKGSKIEIEDQEIIKEGQLEKKGEKRRNWNMRWFILKSKYLLYFNNSNDKILKGFIYLKNCKIQPIFNKKKPHCFSIDTTTRRFVISANSEKEMKDWMNKIKFFTFENEKMKKIEKSQKIQIENLFDCSATEFIHISDRLDYTPSNQTLLSQNPFASEISFEFEEKLVPTNNNDNTENKISTFDENIIASLLPITQLSPATSALKENTRRSISFSEEHCTDINITHNFQSSVGDTSPSPLTSSGDKIKSPKTLPPPPPEIQTIKYASDRRLPHFEESKFEDEEGSRSVSSLPSFSTSQLANQHSSSEEDFETLKIRESDMDRVSVSVFTDIPLKKDDEDAQDDGEEEDFLLKQILTTPPQKGLNVLVKQGYLTKKGAKRRNWNSRWFILKHNYLAYYKNPGVCFFFIPFHLAYELIQLNLQQDREPKGIVVLNNCKVEASDKRPHCFAIVSPVRTYFIYAKNASSQDEWMTAIKSCVP